MIAAALRLVRVRFTVVLSGTLTSSPRRSRRAACTLTVVNASSVIARTVSRISSRYGAEKSACETSRIK